MDNSRLKTSTVILIALAAAFANLIPLLLVVPAGDAIMNYMQVDCFAKQLWSGILYPRWCMDANGGLGSPGPIFYMPLPYYATAIFGPLHLSAEHLYLLGVYLANVLAFISCYAWLRPLTSTKTALFSAFIFLWGFYRAEMMGRASYAEYWAVAMMPLLFMYAREACQSRFRTWPKLAVVITLLLFCHGPATVIGLMAAGIYILLYGRGNWRALLELFTACVLAAMVALFHYLPMRTLEGTLNDTVGGASHWRRSWVNSFVTQPQLYAEHTWALIGAGIALILAIIFCGAAWLNRRRMPDPARREAACWMVIAAFAVAMMFPIGKPLWNLVGMVSGLTTPWRMQALVMFAIILWLSVLAEYSWYKVAKKRTGDMLMTVLLFVFTSLYYMGGVDAKSLDIQARLVPSQYVILFFNTHDVDTRYKSADRFFADFIDRPNRKKAEWIVGSGSVSVDRWDPREIALSGTSQAGGTLRLEHFNYPIWQAERDGIPVRIQSEPISGRMMVDVPRGDYRLRITSHYRDILPQGFGAAWVSAAASLILIALGFVCNRRRCKSSVETPAP